MDGFSYLWNVQTLIVWLSIELCAQSQSNWWIALRSFHHFKDIWFASNPCFRHVLPTINSKNANDPLIYLLASSSSQNSHFCNTLVDEQLPTAYMCAVELVHVDTLNLWSWQIIPKCYILAWYCVFSDNLCCSYNGFLIFIVCCVAQ